MTSRARSSPANVKGVDYAQTMEPLEYEAALRTARRHEPGRWRYAGPSLAATAIAAALLPAVYWIVPMELADGSKNWGALSWYIAAYVAALLASVAAIAISLTGARRCGLGGVNAIALTVSSLEALALLALLAS
jgi:hypothetical protein